MGDAAQVDFSSNYYDLKRASQLFCAALFVFCLSGVTTSEVSVLGFKLDHVASNTIRWCLWLAGTSYFVNYFWVSFLEGRHLLSPRRVPGTNLTDRVDATLVEIHNSTNHLKVLLDEIADKVSKETNFDPVDPVLDIRKHRDRPIYEHIVQYFNLNPPDLDEPRKIVFSETGIGGVDGSQLRNDVSDALIQKITEAAPAAVEAAYDRWLPRVNERIEITARVIDEAQERLRVDGALFVVEVKKAKEAAEAVVKFVEQTNTLSGRRYFIFDLAAPAIVWLVATYQFIAALSGVFPRIG
ncbi:MAG: hypothetical protein JSR45_11515 [Proteobacteria bacterium]|nr:hypothetical protein [Pseudomonadota bacterium]